MIWQRKLVSSSKRFVYKRSVLYFQSICLVLSPTLYTLCSAIQPKIRETDSYIPDINPSTSDSPIIQDVENSKFFYLCFNLHILKCIKRLNDLKLKV
jgi:hypothetical protein